MTISYKLMTLDGTKVLAFCLNDPKPLIDKADRLKLATGNDFKVVEQRRVYDTVTTEVQTANKWLSPIDADEAARDARDKWEQNSD